MLAEYFPVLVFIVISLAIGAVLLLTGGILGKLLGHAQADDEKNSPYECGFEAFEDTRSRFDVRYYLIAILFIIFDLEIAFFIPWALVVDDLVHYFWSRRELDRRWLLMHATAPAADLTDITLVVQEVGKTTMEMGTLHPGDSVEVAGPLGQPTHIEKMGTCVCIGGGAGIAPLLPIARAMRDAGNHVVSILGGRTKELVILRDEMTEASHEMIYTTDDGSFGRKGPGLLPPPIIRRLSWRIRTKTSTKHCAWPAWPRKNAPTPCSPCRTCRPVTTPLMGCIA